MSMKIRNKQFTWIKWDSWSRALDKCIDSINLWNVSEHFERFYCRNNIWIKMGFFDKCNGWLKDFEQIRIGYCGFAHQMQYFALLRRNHFNVLTNKKLWIVYSHCHHHSLQQLWRPPTALCCHNYHQVLLKASTHNSKLFSSNSFAKICKILLFHKTNELDQTF